MSKRYIVGAIVAALVVVGVLVGVSLSGGDGDGGAVAGIEGAAEVQEQFAGIPQSGNIVGRADAPIEVVEYGDLACPACKVAAESTIPELVASHVREGRVKLVFRPIAFISRSSERGALGAEAAGRQDALWPFVELLYRNQGDESDQDWLTDALMEEAAGDLGLDVERWREDYASDAVTSAFFEYDSQARSDGVRATPTFVVRGPRGERSLEGAANLSAFEEAFEEVGPRS